MRSWIGLVTIFFCSGCVPELYSAAANQPWSWTAPDNSWPLTEPPEGIVGVGYNVGEIVPDFLLLDQHGDMVSLWQFYGQVILLDISTMWCAPCQELALTTEHVYEERVDQGFMYITVLQQDVHNEDPELDDLNEWAEMFDITAPILSDPQGASTSTAVQQNQFPAILVIDRKLKVHSRVSQASDAALTEAVDELL